MEATMSTDSDNTVNESRDEPVRTDRDDDPDPNPRERGKWISALLALLGLWMIVQALWLDLAATQFWNDIAVGALLTAVGGYNYSRRTDEQLASTAVAMIAVLVGLWLIAVPFVFGADTGLVETTNDIGFWNDIIVGLLAVGLGAYSAYKARDHRNDVRGRTT